MIDIVDAIEEVRRKTIGCFYDGVRNFKDSKEALSWGFSQNVLLPSETQELKYYFEAIANETLVCLMDMEALFGGATTKEEKVRALSLRIKEEHIEEAKESIFIGIIFTAMDLIMFFLIFISIKHGALMGAIISNILAVILTAFFVSFIFEIVQSLTQKKLIKEAEERYKEYLDKKQTLVEVKELIELIEQKDASYKSA